MSTFKSDIVSDLRDPSSSAPTRMVVVSTCAPDNWLDKTYESITVVSDERDSVVLADRAFESLSSLHRYDDAVRVTRGWSFRASPSFQSVVVRSPLKIWTYEYYDAGFDDVFEVKA